MQLASKSVGLTAVVINSAMNNNDNLGEAENL